MSTWEQFFPWVWDLLGRIEGLCLRSTTRQYHLIILSYGLNLAVWVGSSTISNKSSEFVGWIPRSGQKCLKQQASNNSIKITGKGVATVEGRRLRVQQVVDWYPMHSIKSPILVRKESDFLYISENNYLYRYWIFCSTENSHGDLCSK